MLKKGYLASNLFFASTAHNENTIKKYIKELERMVEELRDQVNYKDEEWYWYWIPERLKYKLLSEDQARELEILKDENIPIVQYKSITK